MTEYCSAGFPHSEISGSMRMCRSPKLIAACHVLRRLLMPRHSPCALFRLTNWFSRIMQAPSVFLFYEIVTLYNIVSTIATKKFPSVALLVFPLFSFQCTALGSGWNQASILNPLSAEAHPQPARWWAKVDSNHRPHDYQSCALAS